MPGNNHSAEVGAAEASRGAAARLQPKAGRNSEISLVCASLAILKGILKMQAGGGKRGHPPAVRERHASISKESNLRYMLMGCCSTCTACRLFDVMEIRALEDHEAEKMAVSL